MNDINQPCVSLASGVLSPDLRVNYEFGLVLGVDEFNQEQLYFLEKDYLHNRALHGYGTVYGLKVEATRPSDDAKDVLVTVEPGLGIDQCGRPILLRNAQCARLKAWLQKQPAGVVAAHGDTSGDIHIYVVASYDECLEALVPIPGAPCSSSESTTAPSRIRDSFNLELRWEPPRMAAWAAVDLFARLMEHVRFVPNLPAIESDEGRIIGYVRELDNPDVVLQLPGNEFFLDSPPADSPPESPPTAEPFLRLPAETAHEALDRIFTVWVTEVRPHILPSLSDSCTAATDAGILLARINFQLGNSNFDIVDVGVPDDTGRPFLLHTQLIQELLFHGNSTDIVAQKPEHEFATLQVRDGHTLRAWVHHPDPLIFPPAISNTPDQAFLLRSNGLQLTIASVTSPTVSNLANGLANLFDIVTDSGEANTMEAGADVELVFLLDELQMRSGGSLQANIAMLNYDYVGHDATASTITVYTIVDMPPQPQMQKPPQPFVTLTPLNVVSGQQLSVELWFHLDLNPLDETVGIDRTLDPTTFDVFAELSKPAKLEQLKVKNIGPVQHNVFDVTLSWPIERVSQGALYLRFVFFPGMGLVDTHLGKIKLGEYIKNNSITFEGYTDKSIVAYLRVPVPSQG